MKYLMSIDQGTTSSRAILFDEDGKIASIKNKEFRQIYPKAGWVEHDAMEIWESQLEVLRYVEQNSDIDRSDIAAVGITNQRETVVMWNKTTGQPIHNAIVWQCRRTADICEDLKSKGYEELFASKTGLIIDAYFSATKIKWLLDNVDGARALADAGELLVGTIDTWLIWNLTGGLIHATDYTNAARTMMFNIYDLKWDEQILKILDIPASILPEVKSSSGEFGRIQMGLPCGGIVIAGVAGDQQSALFGQACFEKGSVKNTYGTGCFMLMNTGDTPITSKNKLLTTIAWGIDGRVTYAMEGSIFMGGASIQWLRDELKMIDNSPQSEEVAAEVEDTGGVYLVPAFAGLGAPWWNMYARGSLVGMTRGTNRAHIVRATLESIAYQSKDVLDAMLADTNIPIPYLKVDGGASANNLLMQFQSDIIDTNIHRPASIETTAWGAACLAGLCVGVFNSLEDISSKWKQDKTFSPNMDKDKRNSLYSGWINAVEMICTEC